MLAMPFTPHQSQFDPETLRALQDAFDQALAAVVAKNDTGIEEQAARDTIAKRIMTAAINDGERDPDRLRDYALQAFGQQSAS